jgi:PAS domain S-box-containing protein
VTTRRHAEDKLRLAAAVYEQTREGVLIADLRGVILSVNPAFCEITAFQPEELQGSPSSSCLPCCMTRPCPRPCRTKSADGHWQGEVMSMRRNGAPLTAWVSMSLRREADQRGGHLIAIVHDVTSVRQVEQKLLRRDHFDGLTDLPNRQLLVDRMTQAMAQARRHQQPLALLFLDVNQLRHVNDNFGHTAGTASCAKWPSACARACARWTPWPAWVATNSPCCCPARRPKAPARWPTS